MKVTRKQSGRCPLGRFVSALRHKLLHYELSKGEQSSPCRKRGKI